MVFVGGDFIHGHGEASGAGGLFDLAAQAARQRIELQGGEGAHVPSAQLRLDFTKLIAQAVDAVGDGSQPFFAEGFQFDGLEVLDLELMFPAPGNQGGLGDAKFSHEPGIAPALGAEFDKTLNGTVVVHNRSFLHPEIRDDLWSPTK